MGIVHLFILAIIAFVLCIVLRSPKFFLAQLFLTLAVFIVNKFVMYDLSFIFSTIQILLTIMILYRLKKAIDYNYLLILEKTHQIPRKITVNGYNGKRFTF